MAEVRTFEQLVGGFHCDPCGARAEHDRGVRVRFGERNNYSVQMCLGCFELAAETLTGHAYEGKMEAQIKRVVSTLAQSKEKP